MVRVQVPQQEKKSRSGGTFLVKRAVGFSSHLARRIDRGFKIVVESSKALAVHNEVRFDGDNRLEVRLKVRAEIDQRRVIRVEIDADRVGHDKLCFIAAGQSIVRSGRALLGRWGIDATQAIVKGYWKRDETEYHAPH